MWWHQRSAVKTIVDTGLPIRHLVSGTVPGMPKLLPRDVPYMFDRLGKGFQLTASSTNGSSGTQGESKDNASDRGSSVLQSLCNDYARAQRRDTSFSVDIPILVPSRGTTRDEPYTYSVPDTPEYFIQHHLLAPPHPESSTTAISSPQPTPLITALPLIATNLEKEALAIARLDALSTGRTITEALAAVHRGIASLTHQPLRDEVDGADTSSHTTPTSASIVILTPLHNSTEVFIRSLGDALRGWASSSPPHGDGDDGTNQQRRLYKILWLPSSQAALSTSLVTSCILSALKEVGALEGTSSPSNTPTAATIRFAVAHYMNRRGAVLRASNIANHTGDGMFVCVGEMDPEPQGGRVTDLSSLFIPSAVPSPGDALSTNVLELVQLCRGLRRDTDVLLLCDNTTTITNAVDYKHLHALANTISDSLLGVSSTSLSSLSALCNTPCSGAVSFINRDLSSTSAHSDRASSCRRISRYIVDKYYSVSCNGVDPYLRPRFVYLPEDLVMDVVSSLGPLLIQNQGDQQPSDTNSSVLAGHVLDEDACVGPLPSSSVLHATETSLDYALNCVSMDVAGYRGSMSRMASCSEDKKRAGMASDDDVLDWALARNLVPSLQHNYALHSKCRLVVGGFSLSYTSGCFYAPTLLYLDDGRLLKTPGGGGSDGVVDGGGGKTSYYSSFSQTPSHELYLDGACVRTLPTIHPVLTSPMTAPVVVLCPYKDQQPQRGVQSTASTQQVLRAHHAASQRAPFVCYAKKLIAAITCEHKGGGDTSTRNPSNYTPYSKANLSETKAAVLIGDTLWKRHCGRISDGRGHMDKVGGGDGATGFDVQIL